MAIESELVRGPLGYAQSGEWWRCHTMTSTGPFVDWRIDGELSIHELEALLAVLNARQEGLRTIFYTGADGQPMQVVHKPYRPRLLLHEHVSDSDTYDFMMSIRFYDFDIYREFSMIAGVVVERGVVRTLLASFSHAISDAVGAAVISSEVNRLLVAAKAGVAADLPLPGSQALDVAREDHSEKGIAASRRALDYWAEELAARPNRMLVGSSKTEIDITSLWWISDTGQETLERVARRYSTTVPILYTAAMHMAFACISASETSVISSHFSGRIKSSTKSGIDLTQIVGCLQRNLWTQINLADRPPLSEIIARAHKAIVTAHLRSRFDHLEYLELEAHEMRRRGFVFNKGVTVNVRRVENRDRAQDWLKLEAPPQMRVATLEGTGVFPNTEGFDSYFNVSWKPNALEVYASFNADIFSFGQMKAILEFPEKLYEQTLESGDMSFDEVVAALDLPRDKSPSGEWLADGRVHVPAVTADLLAEHPDVHSVRLRNEGGCLVAHTVLRNGGMSAADLREFMLDKLRPWISAVVPDRFEISSILPPVEPDESELTSPHPASSTSQTHVEQLRAAMSAAQALTEAVETTNHLSDIDLNEGYIESGGRAMLIPAVIRSLRGLGYEGIAAHDLLRPTCLKKLANLLTTVPRIPDEPLSIWFMRPTPGA